MTNSYRFSPSLLQHFAEAVIWWAWIEEGLGNLLAHLVKADRGSMYAITQNVSDATVTDWIRTLYPIHIENDEMQERIKQTLSQTDEIRAERNSLVHGLWQAGSQPHTAVVSTVRLSRTEIMTDHLVTKADLQESVHSIKELSIQLTEIGRTLGYLPDAPSD